jgi:hypothetical protein
MGDPTWRGQLGIAGLWRLDGQSVSQLYCVSDGVNNERAGSGARES